MVSSTNLLDFAVLLGTKVCFDFRDGELLVVGLLIFVEAIEPSAVRCP